MGRKQRAKNNNVKRERFAVKELARLKKCLGLIDEKGNEISKEVKEIATVTNAKAIKQRNEEKMLVDREETSSKGKLKSVKIVNEKTEVEHIYNTKTMKDQFGNYPVWYKRRDEKKKKKMRGKDDGGKGGKSRRKGRQTLFTVTDPYKNLEYE